MKRRAGILLHPTSLPGPYGIGDLGPEAYRFIDFLHSSGQKLWEVLPLTIPDTHGSPYASSSSMAGSWVLISPELLVQDSLLDPSYLPKKQPVGPVHYHTVKRERLELLLKSFSHFALNATAAQHKRFEAFRKREVSWLKTFAEYKAIKYFFDAKPWYEWPRPLANRNARTLAIWNKKLKNEILFHEYMQWLFSMQWRQLKRYANTRGIRIFGDVPFFVAHDSVDVWANKKLFKIGRNNMPIDVSGAPPDYFSEEGQLWGDPHYNWKKLEKTRFKWWVRRIKKAFELYDMTRLDHFRGFKSLWHIPYKSNEPKDGRWVRVPGEKLFTALKRSLSSLPVVAEDLGTITQDVVDFRNSLRFPGMRVLRFAFDGNNNNFHLPEKYPTNCVVYTGTHDNDTSHGWIEKTGKTKHIKLALTYTGATKNTFAWKLIKVAMHSNANTVIIPLQDVLNLDNDARMNTPSTITGNWSWRFTKKQLTGKQADQLKKLTRKTKRL